MPKLFGWQPWKLIWKLNWLNSLSWLAYLNRWPSVKIWQVYIVEGQTRTIFKVLGVSFKMSNTLGVQSTIYPKMQTSKNLFFFFLAKVNCRQLPPPFSIEILRLLLPLPLFLLLKKPSLLHHSRFLSYTVDLQIWKHRIQIILIFTKTGKLSTRN